MGLPTEYLKSKGSKSETLEWEAQARWAHTLYYNPGLPGETKVYIGSVSRDGQKLLCLLEQNETDKTVKLGIPHSTSPNEPTEYNILALINQGVLGPENTDRYAKVLGMLGLKDKKNKKKIFGPVVKCYQPKIIKNTQALVMSERISPAISKFESDLQSFGLSLAPATVEDLF